MRFLSLSLAVFGFCSCPLSAEAEQPDFPIGEYITDDYFCGIHFRVADILGNPLLAELPLIDAMGRELFPFSQSESMTILMGPIGPEVEPLSSDNKYRIRHELGLILIGSKPLTGPLLREVTERGKKQTFQGHDYYVHDAQDGPCIFVSKDKQRIFITSFEETLQRMMVGGNNTEMAKQFAEASKDAEVAAVYCAATPNAKLAVDRVLSETAFRVDIREEFLDEDGQWDSRRVTEPGKVPPPLDELIQLGVTAQLSLRLDANPMITAKATVASSADARRMNALLTQAVSQGNALLAAQLPEIATEMVQQGLSPYKANQKNRKKQKRVATKFAADLKNLLDLATASLEIQSRENLVSVAVERGKWVEQLVEVLRRPIDKAADERRSQKTRWQTRRYVEACDRFSLDMDRNPQNLEELVKAPKDAGENWDGPYLENGLQADAWGTPLRFQMEGEAGKFAVVLSAGPDKKFDTKDDIVPYSVRNRRDQLEDDKSAEAAEAVE